MVKFSVFLKFVSVSSQPKIQFLAKQTEGNIILPILTVLSNLE
jgi:hypothetical protein